MTDSDTFNADSTDTKSTIMYATFETLNEYGYAGLSISRIAERADISKSSLYHHYSDIDALLYEFLERIIAQLTEEFSLLAFDDPETALEVLLIQGIQGQFPNQIDDVDTEAVAQTLWTLVLGAIVRRTSSNQAELSETYQIVHRCIDKHLLRSK